MSIKKKILLSLGAMIVSSSTILAMNPSASAAPSTFYKTCRRITMRGSLLTASCRKINGGYRGTSLRLIGMHNSNGRLVFSRKMGIKSSFQRSCGKIRIRRDVLSASCRTRNGKVRRTSFRLENIHNRNGFLRNS
ncbi:MAG: CVNH domain-containing protein [Cyanobacteria bacterium P01_A01_bin.84]